MRVARTSPAVWRLWAIGLMMIGLCGGCRSTSPEADIADPVFFPPPPEKPRLQFLKSFSGPEDLGAAGPGGFEKFVLGEVEQQEHITTPYGLALFDGKIYVCDVGRRRVEVLDLRSREFTHLTADRRLMNPVNIHIESDGTKYVADPTAGAVFKFDADNALQAILGRDLGISPLDVITRDSLCYVTDYASNQVVVFDKTTGREVKRIGEEGDGGEQFRLISDLTFGPDGDLYVTDKVKAKIFQFDPAGNLKRTIGRLGDNIDELVRPKGIAIDRDNRIWVVDAGVGLSPAPWSTEIAKIYDPQGRLLLFFGRPGGGPGNMNLPAKIILDYDNVELFRKYAVKGADVQFLVLVSNQYGLDKVNVYGFGDFPVPKQPKQVAREPAPARPERAAPVPQEAPPAPAEAERKADDRSEQQRAEEIAQVYYQSMALYRGGRLQEARAGFVEVLGSGLIPPAMEETLRGYLRDIDSRLVERNRP